MRCITCGADSVPETTTDVTDVQKCLIIVRNVPCHKCTECTEVMYTANVVKKLEKITADAREAMNEIAVTDYDSKVA